MPRLRALARAHRRQVTLADVEELLASPWHEVRLLGAVLLVEHYRLADGVQRRAVVDLVLRSTGRLDNWDLVDTCAPYTLGPWLLEHPDERPVLDRLARSASVWDRRTSVVATFALIRAGQFADTLRLAALLLDDPHDLVHKATGWMLREVGVRDRSLLDAFLRRHVHAMPRTMLRYALEKHSPDERRAVREGRDPVT